MYKIQLLPQLNYKDMRILITLLLIFTISSEICKEFTENSNQLPEFLKGLILDAINQLEDTMGLKFGDEHNPLLISVKVVG